LHDLATYLESTARLRKKVKSAIMYPTGGYGYRHRRHHLSAGKVVPVFGEIYTGSGQASRPDAISHYHQQHH